MLHDLSKIMHFVRKEKEKTDTTGTIFNRHVFGLKCVCVSGWGKSAEKEKTRVPYIADYRRIDYRRQQNKTSE